VRSAVARQTVNQPVIKYHSEFLHLERFLEGNLKEKLLKTSVENSKDPLKFLPKSQYF
jgi:hypothetical protein